MNKNPEKIGISGGTFNPIHCGHLIVAEAVRDKFGLDKVLFVPSGKPPHKSLSSVADPEHRYNMVKLAVSDNPFFAESRIEIEREGYTYTIDTLKKLGSLYRDSATLYYIIGADVLSDLLTWKNYEQVFRVCEFIAVLRPGNHSKDFKKQIDYLKDTYMARIHFIDAPLIEISSTEIRQRIQEGRSIKYLVPGQVEDYIIKNRLYIY